MTTPTCACGNKFPGVRCRKCGREDGHVTRPKSDLMTAPATTATSATVSPSKRSSSWHGRFAAGTGRKRKHGQHV